ncbi:MAG: SpoIIE family protein phosphatase [Candidatus Eremiobacteraeota bacterium]|nr:SpoIIE family protein phosphatase [Candidatus Eremiobacteraeota bacterium]
MRLSIRTQAVLLSAVPLSVLVLVLVFAILSARNAEMTAYWGQHSEDVLAASQAITSSVDDADTALAQYVEHPQPAVLDELKAALASVTHNAQRLEALVSDNPAQEARAQHLAQLIDEFGPIFQNVANAAGDPRKQRAIEQSKTVQNGARDFRKTQGDLERTERQLAIQRFRTLSKQSALFVQTLIGVLVVGIVLTAFAMFVFGGRIVNRLQRLSENATRLVAGEDAVPLKGSDEIADLDAQYRSTTLRMRRGEAISAQLQRALLPKQLPDVAGIRIDASYHTAATNADIGGDWYDVFLLSEDTIGISMGDVTGHGLHAASTMATVRQSIQTAARYTQDAAAVFELVNRNIVDQDSGVVSAFFGILNVRDGCMQYAIAGHPPPITVRASGTIGMLTGSGLLLGVERSARYERLETHLESGAALVLYTDGLVETYRGDFSRGISLLIDAINAEYYNSSENIALAIQNRVFSTVEPHDDSAILFIGVTELGVHAASRERSWQIDAKAVAEARRVKRAFLWHLGQYTNGETDLSSVELILGELLGNVARHTDGYATVTLVLERERAILHVNDRGEPIPELREPVDTFAESGRGLFLVNALARNLRIERDREGNRVSAELPVTLHAD